jgi:parallel beta-helix repeat protein
MNEVAIGIDLGTCYSSVGYHEGQRLHFVKDPAADRLSFSIPSSVLVRRDGSMAFGALAESEKKARPESYQSEFKRDLGALAPYQLGDLSILPVELTERFLGFLVNLTEDTLGRPPEAALITVPATYDDHRNSLVEDAARAVGISHVAVAAEPVAAVVAAARDGNMPIGLDTPATVLVYDLGGGTFDAALVELSAQGHRVVGSRGLGDFGGTDIDRLIEEDFASSAGDELLPLLEGLYSDDPKERSRALRVRIAAQDMCRVVKHRLSTADSAADELNLTISYELTRARLDEMVRPHLQRTVAVCRELVADAGVGWSDVTGVLLVGGSCRMPVVRATVEAMLDRPVWRATEPELVVCAGATALAQEGAGGHARANGRRTSSALPPLVVDASGAEGFPTLAAAVAAAGRGQLINIRPGRYEGAVRLAEPVTLVGDGRRDRIVLVNDGAAVISSNAAEARLSRVTIEHRDASGESAAVEADDGVLVLDNCDIESDAGAVGWQSPAVVEVRDCRLRRESVEASDAAAITAAAPNAAVEHCVISGFNLGIYVDPSLAPDYDPDAPADGDDGDVLIRGNRVDDCVIGIGVNTLLADNEIVENEVTGHREFGIVLAGAGGTIADNRLHDGEGAGIALIEGADADVSGNEISAMGRAGVYIDGSSGRVSGNVIQDGVLTGMVVTNGGWGTVENNEITGNQDAGILLDEQETQPDIRANRITGNQIGVAVQQGAGGVIVDNDIGESVKEGITVAGKGTAPTVQGNKVHDGGDDGIYFSDGAKGEIAKNTVIGNAAAGLRLSNASPTVTDNTVTGNGGGGLVSVGGKPTLAGNNFWRKAVPAEFKGVGDALARADLEAADNAAIALVRKRAGTTVVNSAEAAAKLPQKFLTELDRIWREATGQRLRERGWVSLDSAGVTTLSFFRTHLEKRLKEFGIW